MIPLKISEIVRAIRGRSLRPVPSNLRIKGVSTDTRTIKPHSLFFALKGKNFDGHNFLHQAVKKRAVGLVVSKSSPLKGLLPIYGRRAFRPEPLLIIKVADTLKALGDLARYYRSRITAQLIAITGSNGKTTTKEMLYHILSRDYRVLKAEKSFNNFIGVPLTILSANRHHKYIILELGTNRPGEIPYLAQMVRPEIGVITNISPTHLEGLRTLAGVARDKRSLFNFLKPEGVAVFEADPVRSPPPKGGGRRPPKTGRPSTRLPTAWRLTSNGAGNKWLKGVSKYAEYRLVTFGTHKTARIKGSHLKISPDGIKFTVNKRWSCFIPVMGGWNMANALAAIAVASALGISIRQSISRLRVFKLPPMRMQEQIIKGVRFINDAYNANPRSVSLALAEFKMMRTRGRKILVFGDMLELGKDSRRFHQAVADEISRTGIDALFAVGKEVMTSVERVIQRRTILPAFYFDNAHAAGDFLREYVRKDDLVLLKGSRGIGLEEVIKRCCII